MRLGVSVGLALLTLYHKVNNAAIVPSEGPLPFDALSGRFTLGYDVRKMAQGWGEEAPMPARRARNGIEPSRRSFVVS